MWDLAKKAGVFVVEVNGNWNFILYSLIRHKFQSGKEIKFSLQSDSHINLAETDQGGGWRGELLCSIAGY